MITYKIKYEVCVPILESLQDQLLMPLSELDESISAVISSAVARSVAEQESYTLRELEGRLSRQAVKQDQQLAGSIVQLHSDLEQFHKDLT